MENITKVLKKVDIKYTIRYNYVIVQIEYTMFEGKSLILQGCLNEKNMENDAGNSNDSEYGGHTGTCYAIRK